MRRRRKKRKHQQSGISTDINMAPKMKTGKVQLPNHNIEAGSELPRKSKHKKSKKTKLTLWEGNIMFLLLMENGFLDELLSNNDEFVEIDKDNDYQEFDIFKPNSEKKSSKDTDRDETNQKDELSAVDDKKYFDLDYISED